jgi:hypothetical protein
MVGSPFPNSTAFGNTAETRLCKSGVGQSQPLILLQGSPFTFASLILYSCHIFYEETYKFLTCDGKEEYLSFRAYVAPFAPSLWAGLLLTLLVLSSTHRAFVYMKIKGSRGAAVDLLVPSIFFEQPPQFLNALLGYKSFNVLLISLIFPALIITNSYKSIVTTDLTAPFISTRVDTFEEAVKRGYKILPPILYGHMMYFKEYEFPTTKKTREHLLNTFLNRSSLTQSLWSRLDLLRNNESEKPRRKLRGMLNLIGVPDGFPNVTFEMEILKCNKSIYVNYYLPLNYFRMETLSNGATVNPLYMGKDSFLKELYTWSIENMEWDRTEMVRTRVSAISHSGIFQYLEYVYKFSKMEAEARRVERKIRLAVEDKDAVRPLTLESNLLSIFVIYLAFVSLCVVVATLEILKEVARGAKVNPRIEMGIQILKRTLHY